MVTRLLSLRAEVFSFSSVVSEAILKQRDDRDRRSLCPHGAPAQRDNFPTAFASKLNFLIGPATFGANQSKHLHGTRLRIVRDFDTRSSVSLGKHQTQFAAMHGPIDQGCEFNGLFNFHQTRASALLRRFERDALPAR